MKYWTGNVKYYWLVRWLYRHFPRFTLDLFGSQIADIEAAMKGDQR